MQKTAANPLIYVVEDDVDIARLFCHSLNASGFNTRWFAESSLVIADALKRPPAIFLLDIMLPGEDGFELCRRIRLTSALSASYIVFVTASNSEVDRIRGLDLGADDYLVKPLSPRELVARVRAILRRSRQRSDLELLRAGDLELDFAAMTVRVQGRVIPTTMREFRLLEHLALHPRTVFSRAQLLEAVWVESAFVTPRSVDVYIRRLREKIEVNPEDPTYLKTIRGVGYRFDIPALG